MDQPSGGPTTCPNCGRSVEAGFTFCDNCGSKLEAGPLVTETPPTAGTTEQPAMFGPEQPPLFERIREGRRAKREAKQRERVESAREGLGPIPTPPTTVEHVEQRSPVHSTTPIDPAPPPIVTSKPMRAEDLHTRGPAIGGRAQWHEPEPATETFTDAPVTWHPAEPSKPPPTMGRFFVTMVLHLVIAFAVGAILLAIAATVASLSSNGRVALLEARGLPILIGGSAAIVVFSLLRTGPRSRSQPRRTTAIGLFVGFVVLVAAVTLVYQPSVMASAQRQLDRTLGLFGPEVASSVDEFTAGVDQWNAEVDQFKLATLKTLIDTRRTETDAAKVADAEETFRIEASKAEAALDGIYKRIRNHADSIEHALLRKAMLDLAAVFNDELSGIKQLVRGIVNDDQGLISSGDATFKEATRRAVELFDDRVAPLLERGSIDPEPLRGAIEELTTS